MERLLVRISKAASRDRCEEFTYSEDRLNVFASSGQRSKQFLVVLVLGLAMENR